MNPSLSGPQVDIVIREVLSYQLYRRNKEPLDGVEPRRRIRDRIWRDEGVDLDSMERKGLLRGGYSPPGILFEIETLRLKSGLLWFRSERRVLKGLRPLRGQTGVMRGELFSTGPSISKEVEECLRSDLLFPLFLQETSVKDLDDAGSLLMDRSPQTDPGDVSPEGACKAFLVDAAPSDGEDMEMEAMFTPFRNPSRKGAVAGQGHKDLASLIFSLFELDDGALRDIISSGELQRLCREELHSSYLEGLFDDLNVGPDGTFTPPMTYRDRLGRVVMEGGSGDRFHRTFIRPAIARLVTCSASTASHIGSLLRPLMDTRSVTDLLDILFKVPQDNRAAVISLLGATHDPSAAEPLRRLVEFSNVGSDREAAGAALASISAYHNKMDSIRK